ncbi:MAG: hypothetical protein HQL56_05630 [Magnetococcales bacterium]|nr:hypothetical protein [Magnetococcales bacterium]
MLESILGSREVYFLLAFRGQGVERLADIQNPKGLLSRILRLEELDEMAERARQVVNALKARLAGMRQTVSRVELATSSLAGKKKSKKEKGREKDMRKAELEAAEAKRRQEDANLVTVQQDDAKNEADRTRRNELQVRLDQTKEDVKQAEESLDEALTEARRIHDARNTDLCGQQVQAKKRLGDAEKEKEKISALLADAETIRKAAADKVRLDGEIQELREDYLRKSAVKTDKEKELQAARASIRLEESKRQAKKQEKESWERQAMEHDRRASLVTQVPCLQEADYSGTCPALADARQAPAAREQANLEVEKLRLQVVALDEAIDRETKRIGVLEDELAVAVKALQKCAETGARKRDELSGIEPDAARKAALDVANEQSEDIDRKIKEESEACDTVAEAIAAHEKELQPQIDGIETSHRKRITELRERKESLEKQLQDLPEVTTSALVESAKAKLKKCNEEEEEIRRRYLASENEASRLEGEITALHAEIEASAEVVKQAKRLEKAIADWHLTTLALKGVRDLVIEDAGPALALSTNALLRGCFGSRFTIRINTQEEQRNGVVRETFAVSVLDAETGMESPIGSKSGGEAVWLDRALVGAVAAYFRDATGISYGTIFADEADGPLSADRKEAFARMMKQSIALAGCDRMYFVSHHPGAWEAADHVIRLEDFRQ